MCRLPRSSSQEFDTSRAERQRLAFSCERLNGTTFVLEEHDRWSENPLIYVKVLPETLVLIDTGCGGAIQTPDIQGTLKEFLEDVSVETNGDRPLNPKATKSYAVICTHCHYDHIGGLDEFNETPGLTVWASALGKSTISDPGKLPTASLCRFFGTETPEYSVTHWVQDGDSVTDNNSQDLGLVIYQTPGHTPDQVAVWDPRERHLFVGDTCYENAPILFPNGGSIIQYRQSIKKLRALVDEWNALNGSDTREIASRRVKIGSGHNTKDADAEELLKIVDEFLDRVLSGSVEAKDITSDDYTWAGGQPAVQLKDRENGVYFQGLESVLSEVTDGWC